MYAQDCKHVLDVLKKNIITITTKNRSQSAYHAEGHMNCLAKIVECFILPTMHKTLQVFQLNIQKQNMVQQSLINDEQLKDFRVLAISKPYTWKTDDMVVTVPIGHLNWTKVIPTVQQER